MNLDFIRENFRFNARASALIYNKEQNKVLLFKVEGRDFYMLPGGRIEQLEESSKAIKREIKEEIGYDNLEFSFLALSEEFVQDKGYNNHQINIIYKTIYKNPIKKQTFNGLEGDWIKFEWIDIEKIKQYKIFPTNIKQIILNNGSTNHLVNNLIKERD